MYKQLWLLLTNRAVYLPPVWPEDLWERMFQMADCATRIRVGPLSVEHFDVELTVYSDHIDELFHRMEAVIGCVERLCDSPASWEDRRRTITTYPMAEYLSSDKSGYRAPQSVLEILLEKVAILHYQMERQGIDQSHLYHPYLMRECSFVIHDVEALLSAFIDLRIDP